MSLTPQFPRLPLAILNAPSDPTRRFRLLERVRARLRDGRYSRRTEEAYVAWVRVPVVLSQREVRRLLEQLCDPARLRARLMYGGGLRLLECLTLRVKDVDRDRREIVVRDGEGAKDRRTPLAATAVVPLRVPHL